MGYFLNLSSSASTVNPRGAIKVGAGIDGSELLSTAFSLLFLSKGRTPVLISKFAWGDYRDGGTYPESAPCPAGGDGAGFRYRGRAFPR